RLEQLVHDLSARVRSLEQRTWESNQAARPAAASRTVAANRPASVEVPASASVSRDVPSDVPSVPSSRVETTGAPRPRPDSLENLIGSRWLLYVGVAAILIGVSYFEKLAFESHWVGETARVLQGALFGAALIYTGLVCVRRGYALYGQVLSGCGIAILYGSIYP